MRRGIVWIALLLPLSASAGQVYGTIRDQNGQPLANQPLTVDCGNGNAYSGSTDTSGAYSLSLAVTGRCALKINGGSVDVSSSSNPLRYDVDALASGLQLH